jgi:hypothetical protein
VNHVVPAIAGQEPGHVDVLPAAAARLRLGLTSGKQVLAPQQQI